MILKKLLTIIFDGKTIYEAEKEIEVL